jgi:hypothetical protein
MFFFFSFVIISWENLFGPSPSKSHWWIAINISTCL